VTHPTRLSLLAASVLALSSASAVSLFASGNSQSTTNYCVKQCEEKYFACLDWGWPDPGPICNPMFDECAAKCEYFAS
jgi:hypothetical protein